MNVANIHECRLDADPAEVGGLIDSLATDNDRLWPGDRWPSIRFDRPLGVGATGGHGPIGYIVETYQPGRLVRFRFTGPPGFNGHHWFEVQTDGRQGSLLRHTIHMQTSPRAWLSWLFIIRPLHDALVEDALSRARVAVGMPPQQRPWSLWVRLLRQVRYRQGVQNS